MATIVFVALQCCECSTMQAKQQKKSGNKWTCVVCNQKQSVRKVFARSYMAMDIRRFVQSFNLNRPSNTEPVAQEFLDSMDDQNPSPTHDDDDRKEVFSNQSKRRTDWSQYLDHEEDFQREDITKDFEDKEGEFERRTVTEINKKPKLRNYSGEGNDKLHKPVFLKKNTNKHSTIIGEEPKKKSEQTMAKGASSKWSAYMTETDEEPSSPRPSMAVKASDWSHCVSQEDNETLLESRRHFTDHMGCRRNDVLGAVVDDQNVEDEIHPDFL